jgi:hypothetical protein
MTSEKGMFPFLVEQVLFFQQAKKYKSIPRMVKTVDKEQEKVFH